MMSFMTSCSAAVLQLLLFLVMLQITLLLATLSSSIPLKLHVREQVPPGTEVGRVLPRGEVFPGESAESVTSLRYALRPAAPGTRSLFTIDQNTGLLSTVADVTLDRETICRHLISTCLIDLDVVITSEPTRRYFDVVRVQVVLDDVNDNAPSFPEQSVGVTLTECDRRNTIRLPPADDPDSPIYSVQRYQIIALRDIDASTDQSSFPVFQLSFTQLFDGSHDLRLDMEEIPVSTWRHHRQRRLSIDIMATDGGSPPLNGSLRVDVMVDCKSMDNTFNITVESIGSARVYYDNTTYHVTVPETMAVGTVFARVKVYSSDTTDDVTNLLYMSATRGVAAAMFRLDTQIGEILLNGSLNYESASTSYRLSVKVIRIIDSGTVLRQTSFIDFTVHVTDVNDNPPIIRITYAADRQVAIVDENMPPEVAIADITTSDGDSSENGHVTCHVMSHTTTGDDVQEQFSLRPLVDVVNKRPNDAGSFRFQLVTTSMLDRELCDTYDVMVICHDLAENIIDRMTSSTVIRVQVNDVNDNRPVVKETSIKVTVLENNPLGMRLAAVNATDADTGNNAALLFSASMSTPETETGAISVDRITGVVTAEISFDYEKQRNYDLVVRVCDSAPAVTSLCANDDVIVHVTVVDMNDERPVFERHGYRFSVSENKPGMTRVGQVLAIDTDVSTSYSRVIYGLRSDSAEFDMDSVTGELRTVRSLDREQASMYVLFVCAYDADRPVLHHCVNVTVSVEDVNDNYPIVFDRQHIKLSSDATPGTVVTRIAATDADLGVNARLLYTLVTSSTNDVGDRMFDIDQSTGTLTLVATLPSWTSTALEQVTKQYSLEVAVCDSGQPPLTSVVQLTVELVAPTATASGSTASATGISTTTLLLSVFGGAFGVILIIAIVAVVIVRRQVASCCIRSKTADLSGEGGVAGGDQALAELYNDLSKSLDLVARHTLSRSHDLARSAATLNGPIYGPSRSASMWFSSPDCSVATVPATPTTTAVNGFNCQSLGPTRSCRRHRTRARDAVLRHHSQVHCCHHGDRDVTHYGNWPIEEHSVRLPMRLRRLSSEDDDIVDDSMTSELTSECTDSGRGQSARLSS